MSVPMHINRSQAQFEALLASLQAGYGGPGRQFPYQYFFETGHEKAAFERRLNELNLAFINGRIVQRPPGTNAFGAPVQPPPSTSIPPQQGFPVAPPGGGFPGTPPEMGPPPSEYPIPPRDGYPRIPTPVDGNPPPYGFIPPTDGTNPPREGDPQFGNPPPPADPNTPNFTINGNWFWYNGQWNPNYTYTTDPVGGNTFQPPQLSLPGAGSLFQNQSQSFQPGNLGSSSGVQSTGLQPQQGQQKLNWSNIVNGNTKFEDIFNRSNTRSPQGPTNIFGSS